MSYQHRSTAGAALPLTLGKIVCVGRNYAEHARELNNPVPVTPLLFIKPATAAVPLTEPLTLPQGRGACHFETELALLIGQPLQAATPQQARQAIWGVGLALDLTLRDVQSRLKEQGHPWELAKSFDGACPLSPFVPIEQVAELEALQLRLTLNGELRQQGSPREMMTPIAELLSYMSQHFTLLPGDVVLTGTPAGVGPLQPGDQLVAELDGLLRVETSVR